jgi:hypothetical protein
MIFILGIIAILVFLMALIAMVLVNYFMWIIIKGVNWGIKMFLLLRIKIKQAKIFIRQLKTAFWKYLIKVYTKKLKGE